MSKQQSTYPEEQFDEKQLFEKLVLFWSFSDKERKISGRLAIFFRLSCQNCPLDLRRKIWGEKIKSQLFLSFLASERKFLAFCRILFWGFWKLRVHGNILNKKFLEPNFCLLSYSHKEWTVLSFLLDRFRRGSEQCFIGV